MNDSPSFWKSKDLEALDIPAEMRSAVIKVGICINILLVLIGIVVILGWVFDWQLVVRLRINLASFKANSAICLVLFSLALIRVGQQKLQSQGTSRVLERTLGGIVAFVALVSGIQDLFGLDFGIDQLFINEEVDTGNLFPGRMPPFAEISYFLLGLNLLFKDVRAWVINSSAFITMGLAFGTLVSYLYGSPYLSGLGKYNSLALHSALSLLLAGLATLLIFVPKGPLFVVLTQGPSGRAARRLVPLVILGPVLAGRIRWYAEDLGVVQGEYATAILITLLVCFMCYLSYLLLRDIHRHYHDQIEAQKQSNAKDELLSFKEKIISTVVHDLRSPLAVARGSAEFINRGVSSPEKAPFMSQRIIKSIDRCDRMLRDLLDSVRTESGHGMNLKSTEVNLSKILQLAAQNIKESTGTKVEIKILCKDSVKGIWDQDCVVRIAENLLSNAIKYGDANRPVTLRCDDDGDQAIFEVHNWGNPIPDKDISQLFDLFSRSNPTDLSPAGWGVGLTAVKSLTTALGGKIRVDSSDSNGTTFQVVLPKDRRATPE